MHQYDGLGCSPWSSRDLRAAPGAVYPHVLDSIRCPADWVLATVAVMSDPGSLRVVLIGGSGFLGGGVKHQLIGLGHRVTVVGRGPAGEHPGWRSVQWDAKSLGPWVNDLDGADVIVHLAGKRVDCRPTASHIDELIESREGTVRPGRPGPRRVVPPAERLGSALVARSVR